MISVDEIHNEKIMFHHKDQRHPRSIFSESQRNIPMLFPG